MYLPTKQSESITDAAIKARNLTEILLNNLNPEGPAVTLGSCVDVFSEQPNTRLYRIEEGQIFYRVRGKLVTVFEEGDLIGLNRSLNLNEGTYGCNDQALLAPFDRDQLMAHVVSDVRLQKHWTHYLVCMQAFNQQALAQEIRSEFQPQAGFLHYKAGDVIIKQGEDAEQVYTLLEGSADAVCDNVKVGEVHAGEIFGALAVFTRQPRMASVVATDDCLVLAVRKEEFVDLIDHQPQICLSLIEEMAAKINQLNAQLLNKN